MQEKRTRLSVTIAVILFFASVALVYVLVTKPWQKPDTNQDTIDLTQMNSTMVYAYVNDMVNTNPEQYLGKTVKAQGEYNASYYSGTGKYYYYVVIADATACCVQGIEFLYESSYPTEPAEIIVTGTFDKYTEQGKTYYYINAEALTVL